MVGKAKINLENHSVWYKRAKNNEIPENQLGFEYKILRMCALHLIKQEFLNKGLRGISDKKISTLVERILSEIKLKYRNFNFVRKDSDDHTVSSIVKPFVLKVLKNAK